jgi:hypothetical protein
MKQLGLLLAIALVGLTVGVLAGWTNSTYRYSVAQNDRYQVLPRQALPIVPAQNFCLYADVRYRHGEMIYLSSMDMTQICVVDEKARWSVVPKAGQETTIKFSPDGEQMIITLKYPVKGGETTQK